MIELAKLLIWPLLWVCCLERASNWNDIDDKPLVLWPGQRLETKKAMSTHLVWLFFMKACFWIWSSIYWQLGICLVFHWVRVVWSQMWQFFILHIWIYIHDVEHLCRNNYHIRYRKLVCNAFMPFFLKVLWSFYPYSMYSPRCTFQTTPDKNYTSKSTDGEAILEKYRYEILDYEN